MIHNRFKANKVIGTGSFSTVYEAIDISNGSLVAIKTLNRCSQKDFINEVHTLQAVQSKNHFPKLIWSGSHEEDFFIIMELLGPSLGKYRKSKRPLLTQTSKIGWQITSALKNLHDLGILHRDIKLQNIVRKSSKIQKYYLIDFGLSKAYREKDSKIHFPQQNNVLFKGNLLFCSRNILSGVQASRRDDIISLQLVLIYLIKSLPWANYTATMENMMGSRANVTHNMLVKDLPIEIVKCYEYSLSLGYYQRPDYKWMTGILKKLEMNLAGKFEIFRIREKKKKENTVGRASSMMVFQDDHINDSTIKMGLPEVSEELKKRFLEEKIKDEKIKLISVKSLV